METSEGTSERECAVASGVGLSLRVGVVPAVVTGEGAPVVGAGVGVDEGVGEAVGGGAVVGV